MKCAMNPMRPPRSPSALPTLNRAGKRPLDQAYPWPTECKLVSRRQTCQSTRLTQRQEPNPPIAPTRGEGSGVEPPNGSG